MSVTELDFYCPNEGGRKGVRYNVISKMLEEEAGTGRNEKSSKYKYYVEKLSDGNRIYLTKPTRNKGFDFVVRVENTNYAKQGYRRRNAPTHNDIKDDLVCKKQENPEMYKELYSLLLKVFECQYELCKNDYAHITFSTGLSIEHILKVTKWLFIEQDVTYWNYSGRNMTWSIVPEP